MAWLSVPDHHVGAAFAVVGGFLLCRGLIARRRHSGTPYRGWHDGDQPNCGGGS